MFHCEPQHNEILLAALMVTADVSKIQSYKKHLLFSISVPPKITVVSTTCPGLETCMMGILGLGWGNSFVLVLAAEFLVAPQISQEV